MTAQMTASDPGKPVAASAPGRLVLKDLVKRYAPGADPAVAGIDLEIEPGEFLTLLGPSGCGKTTTLRMIAGFETPTSGSITLDGASVVELPPNHRPMAMVFQSYALFPHMSVSENIAYGLKLKKLSKARIAEEVDFAITSMSLAKLADRAPNQLSGGQQQRVALARAMVMKPKVLLFDEPLSNLDAKLRVQMRTEIRSLQKRMGITAVYVTHDQDEAMSLSDRIVIMNAGKIEQIGTPEDVYRRPVSTFVADFIGRANFIDVMVADVVDGMTRVDVLGAQVLVPSGEQVSLGAAVLLVRPESVRVALDRTSSSVHGSVGRVLSSVFYGESVEYEIETEAGNVTAVVYDPAPKDVFNAGSLVQVGFEPERAWLLPPN